MLIYSCYANTGRPVSISHCFRPSFGLTPQVVVLLMNDTLSSGREFFHPGLIFHYDFSAEAHGLTSTVWTECDQRSHKMFNNRVKLERLCEVYVQFTVVLVVWLFYSVFLHRPLPKNKVWGVIINKSLKSALLKLIPTSPLSLLLGSSFMTHDTYILSPICTLNNTSHLKPHKCTCFCILIIFWNTEHYVLLSFTAVSRRMCEFSCLHLGLERNMQICSPTVEVMHWWVQISSILSTYSQTFTNKANTVSFWLINTKCVVHPLPSAVQLPSFLCSFKEKQQSDSELCFLFTHTPTSVKNTSVAFVWF